MKKETLNQLLKNRDKPMTQEDSELLKQVIEEYPYFHSARTLFTKTLSDLNTINFEKTLKNTAAHTADRAALYHFLYQDKKGKQENLPASKIESVAEVNTGSANEKPATEQATEPQHEISEPVVEEGRTPTGLYIVEEEKIENPDVDEGKREEYPPAEAASSEVQASVDFPEAQQFETEIPSEPGTSDETPLYPEISESPIVPDAELPAEMADEVQPPAEVEPDTAASLHPEEHEFYSTYQPAPFPGDSIHALEIQEGNSDEAPESHQEKIVEEAPTPEVKTEEVSATPANAVWQSLESEKVEEEDQEAAQAALRPEVDQSLTPVAPIAQIGTPETALNEEVVTPEPAPEEPEPEGYESGRESGIEGESDKPAKKEWPIYKAWNFVQEEEQFTEHSSEKEVEKSTEREGNITVAASEIPLSMEGRSFMEWLHYYDVSKVKDTQRHMTEEPGEVVAKGGKVSDETSSKEQTSSPAEKEEKPKNFEFGKNTGKADVMGIIDKFIEEEPRIKPPKTEFYSPSAMAMKSAEEDEDLFSETLARINAEQGNVKKAITMYEKLGKKYPGKFSYFATLIEDLRHKSKN